MSEPWWTPDTDRVSDCCGALSAGEIYNDFARCSKCKEMAGFIKEENDEKDTDKINPQRV